MNKEVYYLVKWDGYSSNENTWEPEKNLLEDNLHLMIE
jgi:hypothetical protein